MELNSKNFHIQSVAIDFNPFTDGELLLTAPATKAQREIWASVKFNSDASCAFNESQIIHLAGNLSIEALQLSIQQLVQRHEALRITFTPDGETLCIANSLSIQTPYIDLSHLCLTEKIDAINKLTLKEVNEPFDLEHGPLIRSKIVRKSDKEHLLLLTVHHIVCDGWSWKILITDVGQLYSSLKFGISPSLEVPERFSAYALKQKYEVETIESSRAEEYWIRQFSDSVPTVDFPTDYPRPILRTFESAREDRQLDPGLISDLKRLARQNSCSFLTLLLVSFEIYLFRITQQREIVVGVPSAGQAFTGNFKLVGHCVHMLPLRSSIDPMQSFVDYLSQRQSAILDAYEHQNFTFSSLLQKLSIVRDSRRIPLIPITFNLDQEDNSFDLQFTSLDVDVRSNQRSYENFEVFINANENKRNGKLVLECQFNTNLYDRATIRRRLAEFETLLKSIVSQPKSKICYLSLLEPSEELILSTINNTSRSYLADQTIHELFQEQVERTPDSLAVNCSDQKITYKELNRRSNLLAHYLQSFGIGPDKLVGLYSDRSINMIVAVLGILKAGGAYVPLDPLSPHERLLDIINSGGICAVINPSSSTAQSLSLSTQVIDLERQWETIAQFDESNPLSLTDSSNLAYVIYTSGTTGKPKGVMIEHHSVINLWHGLDNCIYSNLSISKLRISLNGTLTFDTSVKQLIQLLSGHSIEIIPELLRFDGPGLISYLVEKQIDVFDCTPSQLRLLIDAGILHQNSYPQCVLVGGEPIDKDLWQRLQTSTKVKFFNVYGPTECTVDTTVCRIDLSLPSPILGKPISNVSVHILDSHLQPLPIGVPGELYIGGTGLARGYLNDPLLTTQKFIFYSLDDDAQVRLYRSGDLARLLPDANIEFLGRLDNQVKIRGFRIELGEVEAALLRHPLVDQVVVTDRSDSRGSKILVAYIVLNKNQLLSAQDCRSFLSQYLPDYMIPSCFAFLDVLPLTPNGKIDKRALPDPESITVDSSLSYLAPRDHIEQQLSKIWGKFLRKRLIGVRDNFFDLGGHSLLILRIFAEIEKVFGCKFSLGTIFQNPTIEQLADRIRDCSVSYPWYSLVPIKSEGSRPPLFGIHLLRFHKLAKYLGPDQPFYGLRFGLAQQSREDPLRPLPRRIEDLAAHYVEEIKSVQPGGPYFLIGLSLGGIITYEVAQQLIAAGEEVALLAVCDTYIVPPTVAYHSKRKQLRNLITLFSKPEVIREKLLRRIRIQLYNLKYPEGYVPAVEPPQGESPFFDPYFPKSYPSNVTFFKAEYGDDLRRYSVSFPELDWPKYIKGKLEILSIPGGHTSILDEPNVQILAAQLKSCIDRAIP
jgi:amino acid adenylation domain-containing protein